MIEAQSKGRFPRDVAMAPQSGPQPAAMLSGLGSSRLGSAKQPANNRRAAHRTGCTKQMSDAPRNSVKRDADRFRPLKSRRQISLPLIGELGQLELTVLLLLVLAADVIVATVLWFVVGPLLR
jgi:hypothetical protein